MNQIQNHQQTLEDRIQELLQMNATLQKENAKVKKDNERLKLAVENLTDL